MGEMWGCIVPTIYRSNAPVNRVTGVLAVAFACEPGAVGLVNRCVRRLIELEKAQWKEDPQYAGEYRYALIFLSLAFEGNPEPVTVAGYRISGCHPDKVWPWILTNRRERLGAEYVLFYDEDGLPRPDRPIADYDPTLGRLPCAAVLSPGRIRFA